MGNKSIIIIGAGLSGLSAGCYARMNGYDTTIYEKHTKPGGLCTSWSRKGYTIATSGWVTGSSEESPTYLIWKELGVFPGQPILNYEKYARIEGRKGNCFTIYCDAEKLQKHMLELAPEDEGLITEFIEAINFFAQMKRPIDRPPELQSPNEMKAMQDMMAPHMAFLGKWMGMTITQFGNSFKNPFMREAWGKAASNAFLFAPEASMAFVLMTLAWMHSKNSGYPLGGSSEVIKRIEKRFLDLDGKLQFRSTVSKILTENDIAVGIELDNGEKHRADLVISASDGKSTIFNLLGGKYIDDDIKTRYESLPLWPSIIFISLGVSRDFKEKAISVAGDLICLEEPITHLGEKWERFGIHTYTFDPNVAPQGKTLIRVMLPADYNLWADFREKDIRAYKKEKEALLTQVIDRLEKRYPGITEQIEMKDIATPTTFERYTGNSKGNYLGWLTTAQSMNMYINKELPGLRHFFQTGTWANQSSLSGAVTSGRHVIQIFCNRDNRQFTSSYP